MDPRLTKLLAATVMFSYWLAGAQAVGEPTQARPVEFEGWRARRDSTRTKEGGKAGVPLHVREGRGRTIPSVSEEAKGMVCLCPRQVPSRTALRRKN